MKTSFLLAWRYLSYHRVRSGILVCAVALVAFLPIAMELLIGHYEENMGRRAESTPLLVGARGSRFELLLKALHFEGKISHGITLGELDAAADSKYCRAIPLHLRHTARGFPVVGTTLEYFEFRKLQPARGTLPLLLGDTVLGSAVAERLKLKVGDSIITTNPKLHDISASYPLKLHICGVLDRAGSADDRALFVDLMTAWVIDGIAHGHQKVDSKTDPNLLLSKGPDNVSLNAAITEYNEITPANRGSFHLHADRKDLPITAGILIPKNARSDTILNAALSHDPKLQVQRPRETQGELIRIVFRIKRFFDLNLLLVILASTLFLSLVVFLNLRLRQREIRTLLRIGASRGTIVSIQSVELALILGSGVLVGLLLAWSLTLWTPELIV